MANERKGAGGEDDGGKRGRRKGLKLYVTEPEGRDTKIKNKRRIGEITAVTQKKQIKRTHTKRVITSILTDFVLTRDTADTFEMADSTKP